PTNKNLRTSSNSKNKNVDTALRYKNDDHSGQFGTQRTVNVAGTREKVGITVVQKSGIQCFNCKEYRHFAKECKNPKRVKDSAYHKEKMLLCKQVEQGVPLKAEQYDCDDERVALANLIANLKLNVDENKKIQKQLKKANTTLAQELKECKVVLAETSKSLGESISVRDSCLVVLQTKQTEFEKYKAFNDRTVDLTNLNKSGIQCFNCKEYRHFAKECKNPKRVKDSAYHKEKMLLCKQVEQGVPLKAEQYDWLANTDEEVDERELEAHYSYMAKIQEVPTADSGTDSEPIVQLIIFIVDSGYTKHMTGNLKLLCNFVEKFLETVRFGNDHFVPILGYGDLVQGNVTIDRVYYVEGLNHNLFSVGQFCDADLEVAFRKSTCFVRDLQGIEHQTSTARTLKQNDVVERRNRTLVEAARTMLSALQLPLFFWAEAIATAFEYIHIRFDEIKEVSETSVANNTSGLVPQRHKASGYDNPDPSTSSPSTRKNVHAEENNNAKEGEQLQDDEFTNPFYAPTQEEAESSTHNIDPKMCMYALTVSAAEPKNIKEAMADSAWIEVMQDELHQFDRLQEEVYVAQPDGFVDPDHPEKVYRLRKALYGLKQALRAWYDELSKFLTSKGFTKGLQIHQSPSGIFINQAKYTLEILHKHGMDKGQSIGTPMAKKPKLDADLSGNLDSSFELTANSDADHAGCIDSRKSTSGGIQFLGDKLVSWMSKKQNCTAISSTEAEYVALSASCAQVMWMRTQLQDYGFNYNKIPLYCDS
nr:retrotransposon protein, putative, Ty1-copia subclass [Tanacetum cinerariifolium]